MKKLVIILCIFLTGCSIGMKFSCLDCLRLGMSSSAAKQALDHIPIKTFAIKVDNKNYTVEVYRLVNGEYSANYFLAFDSNGALVYWGYPNEFERSQNILLNKIGSEALKQLK